MCVSLPYAQNSSTLSYMSAKQCLRLGNAPLLSSLFSCGEMFPLLNVLTEFCCLAHNDKGYSHFVLCVLLFAWVVVIRFRQVVWFWNCGVFKSMLTIFIKTTESQMVSLCTEQLKPVCFQTHNSIHVTHSHAISAGVQGQAGSGFKSGLASITNLWIQGFYLFISDHFIFYST